MDSILPSVAVFTEGGAKSCVKSRAETDSFKKEPMGFEQVLKDGT